MQVEKRFTVAAPPDAVWAFLTDPHRVASCLPGAAITGQVDERTYTGTITVKVGPVATSYRGQVRFERLDAAGRTAEITATGQDVRGRGGADLKMTSRIAPLGPGETEVTVSQQIGVTGILAQMGRGMVQDVGDQLFEKFTLAMRAQLEAAAVPAPAGGARAEGGASAAGPAAPLQAEPIQALSLGAGALGRAVGRALRRPAFWVAAVVVALAVWWLWLR